MSFSAQMETKVTRTTYVVRWREGGMAKFMQDDMAKVPADARLTSIDDSHDLILTFEVEAVDEEKELDTTHAQD